MFTVILGTFVMALTYGAFWHNQPARRENSNPSDNQNASGLPSAAHRQGKRLLPLFVFFVGILSGPAQDAPLTNAASVLVQPASFPTGGAQSGSELEPGPQNVWEDGVGE